MDKKFIKIVFDLHCKWAKVPPAYRVFVNGELFAERTYIWQEYYLEEILQVNAEPGQYRIDIENLNPESGTFNIDNRRIEYGPAEWISKKYVEIRNES